MPELRVLIVGASIAGPCAAYWLARSGCSEVTVIERYPSFRRGGQNIDIRSYGVAVMRKMGDMEERVRSRLAPFKGLELVNKTGRVLATMRASGDADRQALVSEFEIFRDDLSEIMYDLSLEAGKGNAGEPNRVRYVFGEQISSLAQPAGENGPIKVEFANGVLQPSEFDLVIACDGATSRTRALGFHCNVRDHIESIDAWGAYFSIPKSILRDGQYGQGYSAVPGRFMGVGPDHDGKTNRVALVGIHPRTSETAPRMEEFRQASRMGTEATKTFVADVFRGAGWQTEQLLELMEKADNFYASEMVQVKMPSLSQGRFVLCGDAGYAAGPTGTGTSLAMLGAYILAGEVASHRNDLPSAIKAYEERMRPVITESQKIPSGMPGIMAPQTTWGLMLRNIIFVVLCNLMALGSSLPLWLGGLFSIAFGNAHGTIIPEYDWGS
ncbi:putative monooxygenase [Acaromyces ingoldii]|uniref:Putative monooxygenase n=1 Tax=Acaromyces ingoldii TaxID=215250 RepID=A0A316YDD3_9BASI|nr:putative monooxygenase [Acaromyces ingoldii]PWN87239.1 putative monooxygenase [Acaromyces ingoldii]